MFGCVVWNGTLVKKEKNLEETWQLNTQLSKISMLLLVLLKQSSCLAILEIFASTMSLVLDHNQEYLVDILPTIFSAWVVVKII